MQQKVWHRNRPLKSTFLELIRFLDNLLALYGGKQVVGNDQGKKRGTKRQASITIC